MKKLIVGIVLLSVVVLPGCIYVSDAQRVSYAPKMIEKAPYESAQQKDWDRFFHRNRRRIGPDAAEGIIGQAIAGIRDPEQITARLDEMGIPNSLYFEERFGLRFIPPGIGFLIRLEDGFLVTRDIQGDILIRENKFPVSAKNVFTGL